MTTEDEVAGWLACCTKTFSSYGKWELLSSCGTWLLIAVASFCGA